jgi:predicted HTH transcriptional regulator
MGNFNYLFLIPKLINPRNPMLAKLFRIAKLCENVDYGFDKMLVWKKAAKNPVRFAVKNFLPIVVLI